MFVLEDFSVHIERSKRAETARRILSLIAGRLKLHEIRMLTAGMFVSMDPSLTREDALEALFYLSSANVGALTFTVAVQTSDEEYVELPSADVIALLESGSLSGIPNPNTGEPFDEDLMVVYYFQVSEKFKELNAGWRGRT